MLVSPIMRASSHAFALFFLALGTSLASEQPPQRHRVEYTVVIETSTATPRRALTRTVRELITTHTSREDLLMHVERRTQGRTPTRVTLRSQTTVESYLRLVD
jgi:hypothetical protein